MHPPALFVPPHSLFPMTEHTMTNDRHTTAPHTRLPHWLLAKGVSGNALRLYVALDQHVDAKTGTASPARATLMSDLNASKAAVKKWTRELIALGALVVEERRQDHGANLPNLYTLTPHAPADVVDQAANN